MFGAISIFFIGPKNIDKLQKYYPLESIFKITSNSSLDREKYYFVHRTPKVNFVGIVLRAVKF